MTRISILALAAITAVSPMYALAQTTPPASTSPPKALPSTATVAQTPGITLRSLPSVLDARERREDWHAAAEQAGARIQDPGLKTQFNQRLSGVVPAVAKLLIGHPQDYALVTVSVYRSAGAPDKQAMMAVTLDGLDSQLGSDFFADVVAGLPQIPGGEGLPTGLTLDAEATSYLVFFLGEKQLEAGDIVHATFGKSIMLATNRVQKDAEAQAVATNRANQTRANAAEARSAAQAQAQANLAAAQAADVPNNNGVATNGYVNGQVAGVAGNPYGYANGYPLVNDGYYYPGVGVPIVILPGEAQTTPEIQQRQVERQHRLERDYQRRAGSAANGSPVTGVQSSPAVGTGSNAVTGVGTSAQTPVTGVGTSAQTPVAGVGTSAQAATPGVGTSAQSATPGVGVSPGTNLNTHGPQPQVPLPQPGQPGGAPAGTHVPATPAPSAGGQTGAVPHPAAGTPGGAPTAGGKK